MLTGKRAILNHLENNPHLVRIMREINNCKAAGSGCKVCRLPTLVRCWTKARLEVQKLAYKKYAGTPELKREMDRLTQEIKKEQGE